ncbi:hypothetical protein Tco_1514444 [Tanacetum coccineum]
MSSYSIPHGSTDPFQADQLLSLESQKPGNGNNYAMLQSIPCSPECKIVDKILLDHLLSYALTATTDVPVVYLQQFWKTVSKVPETNDTIRFKLDTQGILYTVDHEFSDFLLSLLIKLR